MTVNTCVVIRANISKFFSVADTTILRPLSTRGILIENFRLFFIGSFSGSEPVKKWPIFGQKMTDLGPR